MRFAAQMVKRVSFYIDAENEEEAREWLATHDFDDVCLPCYDYDEDFEDTCIIYNVDDEPNDSKDYDMSKKAIKIS